MSDAQRGGGAVQRVRGVLDRLFQERSVVSRRDGKEHEVFPVAVPAAACATVRDWVVREGATRTIEIGLGYGVSALAVCEGLVAQDDPSACHVVIDPFQVKRFGDCGLQLLDEAGVGEMVEFHAEESQVVLPRFMSEGRVFDLAFVDGNHRFDAVFVDLYYLGRLLRRGGVVILDDYQLPGIQRAAAFFVKNLNWAVEALSEVDALHQWAVLRTAREADTRGYRYFVDF